MTNKPDRVLTSGIIPCIISDHDAVFVVIGLRLPKFKSTSKNVTVGKFKKFDLSSFRSDLSKINFNSIKLITPDSNQMWFLWKTMFLDVLNKHAPVDSIKGNNLPYITSEVRQMARQHDFLQKKANRTGSKYLCQAFQHIKKRVTYKVRKLRSEYYLKKIKENEGDLKGTWKILKQVINKGSDQADIQKLLYNGQEINDKRYLRILMIILLVLGKSLLQVFNHLILPPLTIYPTLK